MADRNEGLRISRLIGGGLLLLVGAALVLGNFGILPGANLGAFWPMLLVWVGATRMLGPNRAGHFVSGAVVLALGIFFQLDRFGWIGVSLGDLWPLFLVAAGAAMILEGARARRPGAAGTSPAQETGGRS
ncbi:MAG: LiaI-LiaF-like domain-containing protein [Thermoanaerobaculia bacterium]